MAKLSDTQLVILSAAAQRGNGAILPLPKSIKARGGALTKLIDALKRNRLIRALPRDPDAPLDDRTEPTLVITDAGRRAIGAEVSGEPAPSPSGANEAADGAASEDQAPKPGDAPAAAAAGTKIARVVTLLRGEAGATLAEIVEATGWQAHSVRGAISGTLKKKLGLTVTSHKVEGRGRVYRITVGQRADVEAAS
ncbi:DUF3489 domain-containing protein [Desertibaculum subflavum]|uniref:DUF3489 domain-containing protein n=1 Tax=Desertibaculum subflavum TaxID=2268458 RepID=UPI000E66FAC9